jgi:hypothetical protein
VSEYDIINHGRYTEEERNRDPSDWLRLLKSWVRDDVQDILHDENSPMSARWAARRCLAGDTAFISSAGVHSSLAEFNAITDRIEGKPVQLGEQPTVQVNILNTTTKELLAGIDKIIATAPSPPEIIAESPVVETLPCPKEPKSTKPTKPSAAKAKPKRVRRVLPKRKPANP